jgi:hypothetical protein
MSKEKTGLHVASLVLGILSIVFAAFWYIALPAGIMAIVFGVKSIKMIGSKMGKAGMVTGIVGLSLFAFIYISMILLLVLESHIY